MGEKLFEENEVIEGAVKGFGKRGDPILIKEGRTIFIKHCDGKIFKLDKVKVRITKSLDNFDEAIFIEVVERLNK